MFLPREGSGKVAVRWPGFPGPFEAEHLCYEYYEPFVLALTAKGLPLPDARRLVHEPLYKMSRSGQTFPTMEEGWAYFCKSVLNEHKAYHSSSKKRREAAPESRVELSPEELKISADVYGMIIDEINQLPPQTALIMRLLNVDDRSTTSIAAELGIAEQTVRNIKTGGLKKLLPALVSRGIVPRKRALNYLQKKKKRKENGEQDS